VTLISPITIWC